MYLHLYPLVLQRKCRQTYKIYRNYRKRKFKRKIRNLNKESKNIDRQYIDLKESLFKVESKIERLKSNREDHINSLFEKYEITLDQAIEMKDDNLDVDKRILKI